MNAKKKNIKISDHFAMKDFVCKCGDCQENIRISLGLIGGLELLRSKLKARIEIIKGYVCSECAEKEGKVKRNYHNLGIAADIKSNSAGLKDLFLQAEEIPEFKGIGINLSQKYIHVDSRKDEERTMWVVDAGENIPLTADNRDQYLEKIQ
jgi:hypothetical protein